MTKTSCSLCIATYNWPEALRLCLDSVLMQSHMPTEIIVCDDGSSESTRGVIEDFQKRSPIPVVHVWQPDEGFQLARIRNKGFAVAKGDYIIQTDGDLMLHHNFIRSHLHFSKKGSFLSGTRVPMDEILSAEILQKGKVCYPSIFSGHIRKKYNAIDSTLLATLHMKLAGKQKRYNYVLGCNMSFWKEDLQLVNGYDETFKGWGKEDNDIAVRLMNAKIKLEFLKYAGIAYHFYHREATRENLEENMRMLNDAVLSGKMHIEQGISLHT